MERKVIIIVGPTGSGKTKLSLLLAAKLNTEIISADSRQIYKLLNIGTAKPIEAELKSCKHYCIDLVLPDQEYNVSKFENDALKIINGMQDRSKIPVVVGGSGLYIKALIDGIFNTVDTDEDYRVYLKKLIDEKGKEYLYNLLMEKDPVSAEKMLPQNWKRIIRCLEVIHLTGEPIWKHQQDYARQDELEFIQFGLNWERQQLYNRINYRVDKMIENGLVDEVESLLNLGYNKNLNSLNTVGYKEIISYLSDEISLGRAVELIKRNTRHYAKRQLTWFRKDDRIKWLDIEAESDLDILTEKILKIL